ncbi:cysteine desulfurase NifS [Candidatus Campbellbacteria bacterium CG22_combo_CG10-13_8_21_14_all_36_13]|uniref:Cysteine desulfurase NifS n=1 Tax=Candidatus Campbellbacteria bacterium CG22_combo_CG10-13_8_21_14_all_36_13 TaxID=1974529 RepID=A0A2H0DYX9_9BACT|nr:MAG: cysteine desulfurase NifS [Candidatus Campbellbacteria bacterium CG22_combo_CG10-13_8_21_14_all_36_13]
MKTAHLCAVRSKYDDTIQHNDTIGKMNDNKTKKNNIYLDYMASTPIDSRVLEAMQPFLQERFANSLSIHSDGQSADFFLEQSQKRVAETIGAKKSEIHWTSGGTESNTWALKGVVEYIEEHNNGIKGLHVVLGGIEHSSVSGFLHYAKKKELDVSLVGVDKDGILDIEEFKLALRPETILVSVLYANNEIGTIQPIKKIGEIIKKHRSEGGDNFILPNLDFKFPAFHTDASQAFMYLDCDVDTLGVDLMTLDGHKMYGPKGIGALYIRDGLLLTPMFFSMNSVENKRYGTPATQLVAGFTKASEIAVDERQEFGIRLRELRDYTIESLKKMFPEIIINGSIKERLPNNISFSFPGQNHEFLTVLLDEQGISVATKSACRSVENSSHVIKALGNDGDSAIRISLGKETTKLEIDYFLETLGRILKKS